MNILHLLADEDFHFIRGVFRLENNRIFLFYHALEGGIVPIDGNDGDITAVHVALLADEQKITFVDTDICHAIPLGAQPEIFLAAV